jgi:hypothetical protein
MYSTMSFKSVLGIQIRIRLHPDIFGLIRVLERTLVPVVRDSTFHPRRPIGIRVVANPPCLITPILHLWRRYSMDRRFETADF